MKYYQLSKLEKLKILQHHSKNSNSADSESESLNRFINIRCSQYNRI